MCPSGALRAPRAMDPRRPDAVPDQVPARQDGRAPRSATWGPFRHCLGASAPPVVLLETHGLAGPLTEDVRAVVLPVVIAGHGVHRCAGLLGRLDRDVPVAAGARTPPAEPAVDP